MQAWVVFFFKNIAQTLTVRVNVVKSESACFFLRAQEISLKERKFKKEINLWRVFYGKSTILIIK